MSEIVKCPLATAGIDYPSGVHPEDAAAMFQLDLCDVCQAVVRGSPRLYGMVNPHVLCMGCVMRRSTYRGGQ
jgi:hypothetical protein